MIVQYYLQCQEVLIDGLERVDLPYVQGVTEGEVEVMITKKPNKDNGSCLDTLYIPAGTAFYVLNDDGKTISKLDWRQSVTISG